jgi:ligand-binding sensor domain-containing protein/two-component sensor histidine kinase
MKQANFFVVFLMIPLLFVHGTGAAQNYLYKHFTIADGLPSNTIYNCAQDAKGFLWFGTDAGVVRFDGSRFSTFSPVEDGLSDTEILRTWSDSKGNVWFMGLNGSVCYYNGNRIINERTDQRLLQMRSSQYYLSMAEDKQGNLFFTGYREFAILSPEKLLVKKDIPLENADTINGVSLFRDEDGGINVMSSAGNILRKFKTDGQFDRVPVAYRFKSRAAYPTLRGTILYYTKDNQIIEFDGKKETLLYTPGILLNVSNLQKDSKGNLWIFDYKRGVFILRYKNQVYEEPRLVLSDVGVGTIFEDHAQNIWISTNSTGIFCFPPYFDNNYSYIKAPGILSENLHAVFADANKYLWLGSQSGIVQEFSLPDMVVQRSFSSGRSYNRVLDITGNGEGLVFVCRDDSSFVVRTTERNASVLNVHLAAGALKRGVFIEPHQLMISSSAMLVLVSVKDTRFESVVLDKLARNYGSCYDGFGKVWYSNEKGLFSFSYTDYLRSGQVNAIQIAAQAEFLKDRILDIVPLAKDKVAVASDGSGIGIIENGQLIRVITEKDGLASNICKRLSLAGNVLVVAGNKGLSLLVLRDNYNEVETVFKLDRTNGLASDEVRDVQFNNGLLYIATSKGLVILKLADLLKERSQPSLVYIESFVAGDSLNVLDGMQIPFDLRNLSLRFSCLNLDFYNQSLYQYSLQRGGTTNWVNTATGIIQFSNLAAGDYVLQIRARNRAGQWSAPMVRRFSIKLPFWKSPEFIFLSAFLLLLAGGILFFYLYNTRRKQEKEKLEMRHQVTLLENQALQALMNPHFIFNALGSIQSLLNQHQVEKASDYLTRFSRLVRMNLESASKNFISLEEELERLQLYLRLEKLRFGDQLSFTIKVHEGLDLEEIQIPSMLLQPFVENALLHGILPAMRRGDIAIEIQPLHTDQLEVVIADNGIGINQSFATKAESTHESKGTTLTKERLFMLENLYGKKATLTIADRSTETPPATGTKVTMQLPLVLQ